MPLVNEGDALADDFLQKNLLAPQPLPQQAWEGTGQALLGLMRPSAAAGRALLITAPAALEVFGTGLTDEGKDAYYGWVDRVANNAVDYWTPDPTSMGSAARMVNTVSNVAGSIPQIVGTPSVFLTSAAMDPTVELMNQGVDTKTAATVGGINLAVNAIGLKIPPAFGSGLATRMATGAGANLALGVGADAGSAAVLDDGGFSDLAAGYNWKDPSHRLLDTLMGAAFGLVPDAPRIAPSQANAVLTARNAQHMVVDSAPGVPVDGASAAAHQSVMSDAIAKVLAGEEVNIADAIPLGGMEFTPRPAANDAMPSSTYQDYRRALESGGVADARNPASSAYGADQFTTATWRRVVSTAKPAWAEGLTDAQLLEARSDPAKSAEMASALDDENTAGLQAAGLEATAHTLYAAHHFGINGGKKFARAADDVPMERILTKGQLDANPYLKGKTKGQAIANWDARAKRAGINVDGSRVDTDPAGQALRKRLVEEPEQLMREYAAREDSEGGVVLNTDVARELSPEYMADRTRSADVHEAASDFVKTIYERKLAEPTPEGFERKVMFTAGGTGAGKTTGLQALGEARGKPEIVYDTNMNSLESSIEKVEQALSAGRDVRIAYVYRDPVEALSAGALPRAERQAREFGTGRTVPLEEHAKTHVGVRPTIEALAERYANDPRVTIIAIDNSRGKGSQKVVRLEDLPRVEQNGLYERLSEALENARAGGLDESIYRGFAGAGREAQAALAGNRPGNAADRARPEASARGEVTPETNTEAVAKIAAHYPDAQVVAGFDADGEPVYQPISQALADIEAERQLRVRDADGIVAAANCAIRRGL